MDSPNYTNQIEIISQIARSIPIDFKLYVKEHPSQSIHNWRDPSFYKKIQNITNVELFHPSVSSSELLKHSSLVLTVNGTSCLEAAFYGKPSIVFDDVLYSSLPFVFRIKSYEDLSSTIQQALNTKVDLTDLNKYIDVISENSFDFDYVKVNIAISRKIPNSSYVPDVEISEKNVLEILKDIEGDVKILGAEYIKKINQHAKTTLSNNKSKFDENK